QNIEAIYPLTPLQKGMLFHTIYAPQSGVYFQQLTCTLAGELDASALEKAWQRVVERHPILRTGFAWEGQPKPLQFVRRHVRLPWQQQDWRGLSTGEQAARLETYIRDDRERGFKLSRPPLTRCLLARKKSDEHEFVWSYHHILLDGWSIALLLKEVFAYYEAFRARRDVRIETPRPYQDYLNWLKRQSLEEAETYWRHALKGFSAPTTLNPQRERSSKPATQESEYGESQIHVAAETTANLQAAARRHGLTMNTLVQGMWGLLLSRYSESPDVVFGTVVSGRPESLNGIESMIGLFVNTLPVRVQSRDDEPLLRWLQRLQRQQAESSQYAYSPLVDVQGWSDVPRGQPLFEYIYGFENYPIEKVAGEQGVSIRVGNVRFVEQTNYHLNLMVWESDELLLKLTHARDHFDEATADRMLGNLRTLLEGIVAHLEQPLSALPWLTTGERRQLLSEWNETARAYENDACIHELFEAQARRTPEAVAVVCGAEQLTYNELNRRANRLAHYLRQLGVAPESLVGLCVERSLEMLVGLLGILKAGGAYVPLDPAYPPARLAQMLEDAEVKVLVTQQRLVEQLPAHDARVICLDGEREELERQSDENCRSGATADNLAYVIYTSGSTGRPKGVLSVHRAALNRFNWMWDAFPFGADEVCCQKTSLSFVDSVWEIFGPLLRGIKNVIITDEHVRDPHRLIEQLAANRVSRIVVVPSLLRAVLENSQDLQSKLGRLRYWVSSGEALPSELCARFKERLPECRLINLYGSSEVSADVSCYETSLHETDQPVPIGKPISNMRLYVLDSRLQPVPAGVAGQLYAGGVGLARGYQRRADQTAERFIPDPFAADAGARLYRTGDIARYTATGELEYVGRADYQVKLRGYRIELGEIEAQLRGYQSVKECVVVVRGEAGGSGGAGDKRLVAYVVAETARGEGASSPDVSNQELRAYLGERLPDYMVPQVFVRLPEMPLTPNGKLDRNALPVPELSSMNVGREFEPPRTPVEELIAGVWAEVLGADRVSVNDNFFELGGHSLLAMQVVSRVREACGVEVAVRRMFERPTVRGMAAEVEEGLRGGGVEVGAADEIEAVERGGELP
ncbi:MAG TPA: amino acid adenylation domain-containing protein, partial [Pyrinomonadaceae bacterium]|nr:amino acid adenylation domain-containing protein [Pyrinomonadaceae bacterium]